MISLRNFNEVFMFLQGVQAKQLDPCTDKEPQIFSERKNFSRAWLRTCKASLLHFFENHQLAQRESLRRTTLSSELAQAVQLREQAFERARIVALKENDTDAYLEHLSELKISSLLSIMEITHTFMMRVGARLEKKGGEESGLRIGDGQSHGQLAASDEYRRFKEYVASTKDEFQLVHKKEVFVLQQPNGITASLMPHQLVGLRFLASLHANNINGILADEMGVGKTLQTLAFLLYLKEQRISSGPHLVIAPLTIVREWQDAIREFITGLSFARFDELSSPKEAATSNVVLLALHRVRNFSGELNSISWDFVIVDEAHKAVSNPNTLTSMAVSSVPYKHRLVLTGTPLNSDIQELWSLLYFINPDVFTERASFEEVFRRPFAQCGEDITLTEEERALLVMRMHQILRPFMLRRTKRDVDMNLRITYHELQCPLSLLQENLLRSIRQDGELPAVVESGYTMQSVIAKEKSSQSICNHPFMIPFFSRVLLRMNIPDHEAGMFTLRSSGKFLVLDMLIRRLRHIGKKLVVFSHWLDTIDLVQEYFEWRGWSQHYVVLTGASTAEERQNCVNRFRSDPETLVMLLSIKAGGCGLNLQVAYVVVMMDKDYTATNEDQAVARVFRVGQKETVRAFYLITSDPSETRIVAIADRKNKPRQSIIEGGAYHEQAITEEERQEVLAAATSSDVQCMDLSSLFVEGRDQFRGPASERVRLLDWLLAGSDSNALKTLAATPLDFEILLRDENDVIPCVRNALSLCAQKGTFEECGRGKRDTKGIRYDYPSDAYIERYLEQGLDEEKIIGQYRREQAVKELREISSADVTFNDAVVTTLLSIRRGPTVAARFLLGGSAKQKLADSSHVSHEFTECAANGSTSSLDC